MLNDKFTVDWDTLVLLISDTTVDKVTLFVIRYLFQPTNHSLWRERNCRRHGEPHSTQGTLISTIEKTVLQNRLSIWVLSGYWETFAMKKTYVSGSAQELECGRFIWFFYSLLFWKIQIKTHYDVKWFLDWINLTFIQKKIYSNTNCWRSGKISIKYWLLTC